MTTPENQLAELARTFPSMDRCPAIMQRLPPFDANMLDGWAASGGPSHGERVTAQFLLAVWDPDQEWKSGRFNLMEALRVWDERHREAFLKWASSPWWP